MHGAALAGRPALPAELPHGESYTRVRKSSESPQLHGSACTNDFLPAVQAQPALLRSSQQGRSLLGLSSSAQQPSSDGYRRTPASHCKAPAKKALTNKGVQGTLSSSWTEADMASSGLMEQILVHLKVSLARVGCSITQLRNKQRFKADFAPHPFPNLKCSNTNKCSNTKVCNRSHPNACNKTPLTPACCLTTFSPNPRHNQVTTCNPYGQFLAAEETPFLCYFLRWLLILSAGICKVSLQEEYGCMKQYFII